MPGLFKQQDPVLPLFFPSALVAYMQNRGHTVETLLRKTGLQYNQLFSPDARASFRQIEQLISNCECAFAESDADRHLGLCFGQSLSLLSLGMLGQAALASDTVGDGLSIITRYFQLRDPLVAFRAEPHVDCLLFKFNSPIQLGAAQDFIVDAAFSAVQTFVSELSSGSGGALKFQFSKAGNGEISHYQQTLGDEVSFDNQRDVVVIPSSVLGARIQTSNTINLIEAQHYLEKELGRAWRALAFSHVVRTLITAKLSQPPTEQQAAQLLGHSDRNLRRRLANEQTSYRKILGEVRQTTALSLLQTTHLSIAAIAEQLGYKNVGNFSRAFKKQNGHPPSSIRLGPQNSA